MVSVEFECIADVCFIGSFVLHHHVIIILTAADKKMVKPLNFKSFLQSFTFQYTSEALRVGRTGVILVVFRIAIHLCMLQGIQI